MTVRSVCFVFVAVAIFNTALSENFSDVEQDFTQYMYTTWPEYASAYRVPGYDAKIESYSLSSFDGIRNKISSLNKRLINIDTSQINKTTFLNYRILMLAFRSIEDGYKWRMYGSLNPVSFRSGPQKSYTRVKIPLKTEQNFRDVISRQIRIANKIVECIKRMKEAVKIGRTNHKVSMIGSIAQIKNRIALKGTYPEFKKRLMSSKLSHTLKKSLDMNILRAINQFLLPAYRTLLDFIQNEYIGNTRKTYGISGWPGGSWFYKACLKQHTGTNLSPRQIMDIGLTEVGRIRNQMTKIIKRLGYNNLSIPQFFERAKSLPSMTFNTSDEIISAYQDIVEKVVPKARLLFHEDIFSPIRVVPMPVDAAVAYYTSTIEDGKLIGLISVNTFRPKSRLRLDMISLALHVSVPGHHMQMTAKHNANLPFYRKNTFIDSHFKTPYRFNPYTSFYEGWCVYAEFLGEELGVYDDDYKLIGRYRAEMFRALRLVVDTGIHAFGWGRYHAIKYTIDNSGFPRNMVERSIDQYITEPGLACAYKIGELKIKELRKKAKKELGSKFDVRDFHSVCLKSGTVPLSILEELVDDYINDTKTQGTTTPASDVISLSASFNVVLAFSAFVVHIARN